MSRHNAGRAVRGAFAGRMSILSIIVLCAILPFSTGCAVLVGGAAGGTGVAYVSGDLEVTVQSDPKSIAEATLRAFETLEIRKRSVEISEIDARVEGSTVTHKRVLVNIKRKAEGISNISIRVGIFGDKDLSQVIYAEIRKQLK